MPRTAAGFDSTLILWLNLAGTFVFGLSGGLAARRARLDLFGVLVLSLVVALAGDRRRRPHRQAARHLSGLALPGCGRTFDEKAMPATPDVVAPDGSDVRVLLGLARGGMAHFSLDPGQTSIAVRHRTVEEVWYVLRGEGTMWRRGPNGERTVSMWPGDTLTIPVGTDFQFRSVGHEPLRVVAVTMPPWPDDGEAVRAEGPWAPTRAAGPGLVEED